jgi:phosphoglycolate phosphatase-like HAD superfamily hydrolase
MDVNRFIWNSGSTTTYTTAINTDVVIYKKRLRQVYEKSKYEIWIEALAKLLEKGYEIDIVTGGVIQCQNRTSRP